jgi:hypothetical protein
MTKSKRRALRVAHKMAYRIWQHVKSKGYALPVPKRTPKLVKHYMRKILRANKIKWVIKNPPKLELKKVRTTYFGTQWIVYDAQKSGLDAYITQFSSKKKAQKYINDRR